MRRYLEERFTPEQRIIWTGDMNVAPEPVDVYHPDRRVNDVDFHIDAPPALVRHVSQLAARYLKATTRQGWETPR